MESKIYQLSLTQIVGIGPILAKQAIAFAGSADKVFQLSYSELLKIPGFGEKSARAVSDFNAFDVVEQQWESLQKHKIKAVFYLDGEYPYRLRQLPDCPLFLFVKGELQLSPLRCIGVVGTRKMTAYGKQMISEFAEGFRGLDVTVFSGLAYGVDIATHKACNERAIKNFAVLAHGLDRIYPPTHSSTARKSLENGGGLISEYLPGVMPDRENFPKRNRILAALVDVLLVVESADKGGSLISASYASDLNREVMAIPGDVNNKYSIGCNRLIKYHKAHLYEKPEDLIRLMNWDVERNKGLQIPMFNSLSKEEQEVYSIIKSFKTIELQHLVLESKRTSSYLAGVLLELELKNCIYSLPGMRYKCR